MVFIRDVRRRITFVAVGTVCFAAQVGVLDVLRRLGSPGPAADAIGFGLSAQLNFVLSSALTWRDRAAAGGRRARLARWAGYNATAMVSLVANTIVFAALYHSVGEGPAAAAGVLSGMGLTYLGCDRLIFRVGRARSRPVRSVPAASPAHDGHMAVRPHHPIPAHPPTIPAVPVTLPADAT